METNIFSPPGPVLETHPTTDDATLSGPPIVMVVYDASGTPYYFKAYPVKA